MITTALQGLPLVDIPTYHRKPGKKKRPGSVDFDPKTGRVAWVLGYCATCHNKLLGTSDDVTALKLGYRTSQKSILYRVFTALANRYKDE